MNATADRGLAGYRRLAIVPARGGSKRIPNKNIRNFVDRPMIHHPLAAAQASGLFERILVSTDSDLVRACVAEMGIVVDALRPAYLSDDRAGLIEVLQYEVQRLAGQGETYDRVCLLFPCSPLLLAEDLLGAAQLADEKGPNSAVVAVGRYPAPPTWAHRMDENGTLVAMDPDSLLRNSQDFGAMYFDAGCFSFFPASSLMVAGQELGSRYGYVLPRSRTVDIDESDDWLFAETLYAALRAETV